MNQGSENILFEVQRARDFGDWVSESLVGRQKWVMRDIL